MKDADSKPMQIPDDIAAKCDASNQFQNFDRLFRKVITKPPQHREAKPTDKSKEKPPTY